MGETKTCTKCRIEKPVGEFHKHRSGYNPRCKVCRNEERKAYYEENREAALERERRYREANVDKIRERKRRYWEENREVVREQNQQYRKTNPQRVALCRAIKDSPLAEEELLNGQNREAINASLRFDYLLRDLITAKTGIDHHVDHIVPISKGGRHTLANIRVIPAALNLSKYDKFDHEWFDLTDEDIERLDREALEFTP